MDFPLRRLFCAVMTLPLLAACTGGGGGESGPEAHFVAVTESETLPDSYGYPQVVAKDEALVTLREAASEEALAALRAAIALNGSELVAWDRRLGTLQVRGRVTDEFLMNVSWMEGVLAVSRNCRMEAAGANGSGRAAAAKAALRPAPTVNGAWWIDAIRADRAWDFTEGSPAVTAAIVDEGFPLGQELLDEGRVTRYRYDGAKILPPPAVAEPFGGDSGNAAPSPGAEAQPVVGSAPESHGAKMAGFALGFREDEEGFDDWSNEGGNVAGVDHAASLAFVQLPKRTGGAGGFAWTTDLLRAVDTALDKSDLVSVPYVADAVGCEGVEDQLTCSLMRQRAWRGAAAKLIERARETGALLFFPAGNDGFTGDDWPYYFSETTLDSWWFEHVMTVGATRQAAAGGVEMSPFSRSGFMIDLFAPGEDIGFTQDAVEDYNHGRLADGTSYSAALALGTASLMKAELPNLAPCETRKIIFDSSPLQIPMYFGNMPHLSAYRSVAMARSLKDVPFTRAPMAKVPGTGESVRQVLSATLPDNGYQYVDVVFLFDETGSHWWQIDNARSYAAALMEDLDRRGVNAAFGVAAFADYPMNGWGDLESSDRAFYLIQELTANPDVAIAKLGELTSQGGNDGPESQLEALYQCVTGEGRDVNGDRDYSDTEDIAPSSMGWRQGSARYIILFTDDSFHTPEIDVGYPGPTWGQTLEELQYNDIKVISIDSSPRIDDLQRVAEETGGAYFEAQADSEQFVYDMNQTIEWPDQLASVWCEVIGGSTYAPWFSPSDYLDGVEPGQTVEFEMNFSSPLVSANLKEGAKDEVVVWIRANGRVIARHRVPVELVGSLPE